MCSCLMYTQEIKTRFKSRIQQPLFHMTHLENRKEKEQTQFSKRSNHGNHVFFYPVLGTRKCKHIGNKPGGCSRVLRFLDGRGTLWKWISTLALGCVRTRECVLFFSRSFVLAPSKHGTRGADGTNPAFSYRFLLTTLGRPGLFASE